MMRSLHRPLSCKSAAKKLSSALQGSMTTQATKLRSFSSLSSMPPDQKIRSVFEEYRQVHFSRELPSRFKKEVVKVIEGPDKKVDLGNFNILFQNIGRQDASLTEAEIDDLVKAVGSSDRKIPTEKAMKLLC